MPPPPDQLDPETGTSRQVFAVRMPGATYTTTTRPVSAPPSVADGRPGPEGYAARVLDPSVAVGSARVREQTRPPRPASGPRGPRRARLTVKRLDPWSVMKFSAAVSFVMFIVIIVAASVLYLALDALGVFASVNNTLADLIDSGGGEGFQITARGVIGTAGVLGAINMFLFTALATLGAFIYNVCADLVGGVEVTLAERD
jgi:hypothetical protein